MSRTQKTQARSCLRLFAYPCLLRLVFVYIFAYGALALEVTVTTVNGLQELQTDQLLFANRCFGRAPQEHDLHDSNRQSSGVTLDYEIDFKSALIKQSHRVASQMQREITQGAIEDLGKVDHVSAGVKPSPTGPLEAATTLKVSFEEREAYLAFKKVITSYLGQHHPSYNMIESDDQEKAVYLRLKTRALDELKTKTLQRTIEVLKKRLTQPIKVESPSTTSIFNRVAKFLKKSRPQDHDVAVSPLGVDRVRVYISGPDTGSLEEKKKLLARVGLLHFRVVEYDQEVNTLFFDKIRAKAPAPRRWPDALSGVSQDHKTYVKDEIVRSTSREILVYMTHNMVDGQHLVGIEEIYINLRSSTLEPLTYLSQRQEREIAQSTGYDPKASVVKGYQLYYLRLEGLDGDLAKDASIGYDHYSHPVVKLSLNERARTQFADLTAKNIRRMIAILVDDVVYSAPRIIDRISGGRVQISLGPKSGSKIEDHKGLAMVLRGGSLPAPLKLVRTYTTPRSSD